MLSFTPIDNSELIETKFIDDEVNKTINPIIDHKKVRFFPADNAWNLIEKLKINLNFYIEITPPTIPPTYKYANQPLQNGPGYYGDIGFTYDDIFCRTDRIINSFLRLNFFDTNVSSSNSLLFFNDIFTQIGPDQKNQFNFVLPVEQAPVNYYLGDSVLEPEMIHEGFYIYWYKDLVDEAPNQELELYVAAVYNNAANGETVGMYTVKTSDYRDIEAADINGPDGTNYLKVVLKNDNGIYKYTFSGSTEQLAPNGGVDNNPTSPNDTPTITFWQISPNAGE
jgi:hypothetical protein